jgi:DNA-binding transcriptional LysR family regulator
LLNEGRDVLQSAMRLEAHVHQIAVGWEPELRIAVGDLVSSLRIQDLVLRFFGEFADRTRIRLSQEVYGGCWDALANDRADLIIGAPPGVPAGGGYAIQPLRTLDFVFVVAPDHPLARMPEPLSTQQVKSFRAVSAADSSRSLPPRTSGLITGQNVVSVQDMWQKRVAQIKGLGVGFLPRYLVNHDLAAGRLIEKRVDAPKEGAALLVAWPGNYRGSALAWFREELKKPAFLDELFSDIDPTRAC